MTATMIEKRVRKRLVVDSRCVSKSRANSRPLDWWPGCADGLRLHYYRRHYHHRNVDYAFWRPGWPICWPNTKRDRPLKIKCPSRRSDKPTQWIALRFRRIFCRSRWHVCWDFSTNAAGIRLDINTQKNWHSTLKNFEFFLHFSSEFVCVMSAIHWNPVEL